MFQDRSTNSETKNNLRYLARDMYISRTMTPQFPTRSHLTPLPPCMLRTHSSQSQQSMQRSIVVVGELNASCSPAAGLAYL